MICIAYKIRRNYNLSQFILEAHFNGHNATMSSLILFSGQNCDASEGKQEEKENDGHNALSKCLG